MTGSVEYSVNDLWQTKPNSLINHFYTEPSTLNCIAERNAVREWFVNPSCILKATTLLRISLTGSNTWLKRIATSLLWSVPVDLMKVKLPFHWGKREFETEQPWAGCIKIIISHWYASLIPTKVLRLFHHNLYWAILFIFSIKQTV